MGSAASQKLSDSVTGGNRLLRGMVRGVFQGPTHRRLRCDRVCSGGNLPLVSSVPFPSVPPWKMSHCVLSEAEAKAGVQSFCFLFKPSTSEPPPSATGPRSG